MTVLNMAVTVLIFAVTVLQTARQVYKVSTMSRETEHKLANVSIGTKVEFKDRSNHLSPET